MAVSTSPPDGSGHADVTLVGTAAGETGGRREHELANLTRGTLIGRYVVLNKIGSGGMGVVYAAYDPELDRKVAVKVLVVGFSGGGGRTEGRARLLREAQALAKLSHPNVVSIYDVGTVDDRVWLAMEFVDGMTLGAWLKAKPRGWREIRDVLVAAGRGLAAAHKKGMLHRDFKPDNVMVGVDGRVRVMDFGLARADEDAAGAEAMSRLYESAIQEATSISGNLTGSARSASGLMNSDVTRAGALLGTPAYLAPEIFRGDRWSASTDQFAFCVTLWEALYGERPFDGDNLVELATHVLEGTMRPPPRANKVPGWLRRVCLRGLAVDPDRRFADMPAVLAALQRDPAQARWRIGVGLATLALLAGGWTWQYLGERKAREDCLAQADAMDQVWNPDQREALDARMQQIGGRYAQETAKRVDAAIDDYASAWKTARRSVCERDDASSDNPRVTSHHPDPQLVAFQAQCFDAGLDAVDALTSMLREAERDQLRHAVVTAVELPDLMACSDADRLRERGVRTTAEQRDQAHAVARALISARLRLRAGQIERARDDATSARKSAGAMKLDALAVEAGFVMGAIAHRAGEFAQAEKDLREAYFEALRLYRADIATEAAVELARLHTVGRVNFELAETWLAHARALAGRSHDAPTPLRARLAEATASLATERAQYEQAETALREAIAILEQGFGPMHPDVGLLYGHLAELHDDRGDFDDAVRDAQHALELLKTSLGATHPDNSQAIFAWATAAWKTGQGRKSLELSQQALDLRREAFGPDHVSVAEALNSVGNAHIQMGEWEAANAAHQRALEIRKAVYGPDEPRVATSLVNLADVAVHAGRPTEGIDYAQQSLRIWETKLGKDHAYCAYALIVIGEGELLAGRPERALPAFDRALAIRRAGDESELQLAEPLTGRGRALFELGQTSAAIEVLEEAQAIRERNPSEELHAPDTAFELARALWREGTDRSRALLLARSARDQFRRVSAARPEGLAAVEAWISARDSTDTKLTPR